MDEIEKQINSLIKGSIDLHIHSAPDTFVRLLDDFEVAEQARKAGMKAIVIKCHHSLTVDRAYLVRKVVRGIDVFGGICLNYSVGGLNPNAVKTALNFSSGRDLMKIVWMPTLDTDNHFKKFGQRGKGISILKNGKLNEETKEIIDIIRENDLVLATGHLSPQEIRVLVKEAFDQHIDKILINHPNSDIINLPLEDQKSLAVKGAYIEICYLTCLRSQGETTLSEIAKKIKIIGADKCIMSTDLGQPDNPSPVDGLRDFIKGLLLNGITIEEICKMIKINPAILLR
jgi:hypothetical protein